MMVLKIFKEHLIDVCHIKNQILVSQYLSAKVRKSTTVVINNVRNVFFL